MMGQASSSSTQQQYVQQFAPTKSCNEVWITVAHAAEPTDTAQLQQQTPGHIYGYAGPWIAETIVKQSFNKVPISVFVGQVGVTHCDLNRVTCRKLSGFRETLIQNANEIGCAKLILDIHTFPPSTVSLNSYDPYEMAIVVEGDYKASGDYAKRLLATLDKQQVNATIVQGVKTGEHDAFQRIGVPCVLLEFNESMTKDRATQLASAIATTL